jgi:L-aspartate oxidase
LLQLGADFVIIGSGIAALRAAVSLAGAGEVLVLTKAEPRESSTGYAQGGIAAALPGGEDSPARHAEDTLRAGDGLCDEEAVRVLVEEGSNYVQELLDWGAMFDRQPGGQVALTIEAGHSVRRVLHAHDATGQEIARVLWQRASGLPSVKVVQHALVTDLRLGGGGCSGARFLQLDGEEGLADAEATLLATGGAGQVFRETTNPAVATGDGIAMAYRAGARVCDLEFVQFHPTALSVPGAPRFLLSEALRGEGARLVNEGGDAFMARYDPAGDLAPRDRVARAIAQEAERTGQRVYLTLQHLPGDFVHRRFPLISAACRRAGLDLARDRIPVGPAAHYIMGGVETDLDGRTSVPGLFAAGEVACTRVHGANRLASNSLLEGLVFGARAAEGMKAWARSSRLSWPFAPPPSSRLVQDGAGGVPDRDAAQRGSLPVVRRGSLSADRAGLDVPDLMWQAAGLFRSEAGLRRAMAALDSGWRAQETGRAAGQPLTAEGARQSSLVTVGCLIARAALRRRESRGAHFRSDHPARDDVHWRLHLAEVKG